MRGTAEARGTTYLTVTTETDKKEQGSYVLKAMYPFSTLTPLAANVDDMQKCYSETRQGSQLTKWKVVVRDAGSP